MAGARGKTSGGIGCPTGASRGLRDNDLGTPWGIWYTISNGSVSDFDKLGIRLKLRVPNASSFACFCRMFMIVLATSLVVVETDSSCNMSAID